MYMFFRTVHAHSEEVHETATEATVHYFEFLLNPVYAIATFFIVLAVLILVLHALKFSISKITFLITLVSLVAGVLGFLYVPALGVVGITLGFSMALMLTLTGILQWSASSAFQIREVIPFH